MNLNNNATPNFMGIDSQEIKTIEFIAEGLTCIEIGERLQINPGKIDKIRKNLIVRTKTRNTASLVSFAYRYGLLKVS